MPMTIITPLVHTPDEHNIVVMPNSEALQKIVDIQNNLKLLLGDAIYTTPPNALHMTLMEVICHASYAGLPRQQLFTEWYEHYNDATAATISDFSPIQAHFGELFVSPGAIILKAANPKPFNNIRAALLANIVLPPDTKMPPDIAHFSIARFSQEIDVDIVREQAKTITVDFNILVNEFRLMKDLGPPFSPTFLETYPLSH